MKKAFLVFITIISVFSLASCVLEPTVSEVETLSQLLESLGFGDKEIKLASDIDISSGGYTSTNPLILDLTGVELDLNGHSICGIMSSSVSGNGDHSYQTVDCSLRVVGSNFTIKNGSLKLSPSTKYPIALVVNQSSFSSNVNSSEYADTKEYADFTEYKSTHKYGDNARYSRITLSDIVCDNGGIMITDSEAELINCSFTQISKSYTNSIANITCTFSKVTIIGGTYNNYQSVATGKFVRWLKLYWSTGIVKNGVTHNLNSSHYKYVEDSMFYPEKSSTGIELPEISK